MEAVLALVPEEERVSYSAMTGQSLFYMGEEDLKHKVLAIVEEEGSGAGIVRLEAPPVGRPADDRLDGQGPLVGGGPSPTSTGSRGRSRSS